MPPDLFIGFEYNIFKWKKYVHILGDALICCFAKNKMRLRISLLA